MCSPSWLQQFSPPPQEVSHCFGPTPFNIKGACRQPRGHRVRSRGRVRAHHPRPPRKLRRAQGPSGHGVAIFFLSPPWVKKILVNEFTREKYSGSIFTKSKIPDSPRGRILCVLPSHLDFLLANDLLHFLPLPLVYLFCLVLVCLRIFPMTEALWLALQLNRTVVFFSPRHKQSACVQFIVLLRGKTPPWWEIQPG